MNILKKCSVFATFVFMILFVPHHAFARSDAAAVVGDLIQKGKITEARAAVEKYLKKDPDDIDAIMMKGNVILNEYLGGKGVITIAANENESIYDKSIGFISEPVYVVPVEVAEKVAKLWRRCLELDVSRDDIHKGLCYIYSMALMKRELLAHLPRMKAALPGITELYYNMGDYARMFEERDRLDDCLAIYKAILDLYPDVAGLFSDVAGIHFRYGKMDKAKEYMSLAMRKSNPDAMTFENAVLIFTVAGDYKKATEAYKGLSKINGNSDWLLYEALVEYSDGQAGWKGTMKAYLKGNGTNGEGKSFVEFLLSDRNKGDYAGYEKSIELAQTSVYQMLLHKKGMSSFGERFEPRFRYAEMMTFYKNYDEAVKNFKVILSRNAKLKPDEKQQLNFYYAWALEDSGRREDAARIWQDFLNSKNFYEKSVAAYFLGKKSLDRGDKQEALKYFRLVSDKASDSKYATMCWNRMNWLKDQERKK